MRKELTQKQINRRKWAKRISLVIAAFTAGWLACYAWGFWLLYQALMRACEHGMFICS